MSETTKTSHRILHYCLPLALGLAASSVAGCGGGDGGDDGQAADAGATADAQGAADADPAEFCVSLEASYGDLGTLAGTAIIEPIDDEDPTGPMFLTLSFPLNQDANPDLLRIELWDTNSPFQSGFTTGAFSLSGPQTDLIECGTCVYISADFVAGQNQKFHMASAGTLSITELDATPGTGHVAGSISAVTLREVMIAQTGQSDVVDGCVTGVDALSFDVAVMTP